MSKLFAKIAGFFSNRTMVGIDKAGNRYFARNEVIDGVTKEKRYVIFKGEQEPTSVPVEWICWLNGQRKRAPTPEEMIEMEARRELVRQNVALANGHRVELIPIPKLEILYDIIYGKNAKVYLNLMALNLLPCALFVTSQSYAHYSLKKEEEERKALQRNTLRPKIPDKVGGPDLQSFLHQVRSEAGEPEETSDAAVNKSGEAEPEKEKTLRPQETPEPQTTEPTGSGPSFQPGVWQPPS